MQSALFTAQVCWLGRGAGHRLLLTIQGILVTIVDVAITSLTICFLYRRRDMETHTNANSLIRRLIL